jgi:hypothetical protein
MAKQAWDTTLQNNSITGNNITANNWDGIRLYALLTTS